MRINIKIEKIKYLFFLLILLSIFFVVIFISQEIISKLIILSPFLILLINYIITIEKEKREIKREKLELQREIQYFLKIFLKWIVGKKSLRSQLEHYVLKNSVKFEKYFGMAILRIEELSAEEQNEYEKWKDTEFIPLYVIYLLEGRYILDYYIEVSGPFVDGYIEIKEGNSYIGEDLPLNQKRILIKERMNKIIKEMIEYAKNEFKINLEKPQKIF